MVGQKMVGFLNKPAILEKKQVSFEASIGMYTAKRIYRDICFYQELPRL
jgi:hypothetical protein